METKCVVEECEKQASTRGLCNLHYQSANRSVRNKETTWEELEKYKLAVSSKKKSNIVLELLQRKKQVN